jgi:NADH-quinone oxidoreductase subunit L
MIENLFLTIFFSPFVWVGLLGVIFFTKIKIPEYILSESLKFYSLYMTTLTLLLFFATWMNPHHKFLYDYAPWIEVGDYNFKIRFIVDTLGATYALLSAALIGIIFKFSRNYLHKEDGYFRFIFLMSILLFGLIIVSFARSLDLMFAGWELVGTTSVLLISYFYTQVNPVRHSLKAIISYRICDMGILAASAWAHHHLHTTDFIALPEALAHSHDMVGTLAIGSFVIWASLAKSGQLPMSSWLPTAMEGPTPSSAIFYGALSVHLGPFLLLRFHDYLEHFPVLLWAIGLIGGFSAIYASLVGRTRSDAKTMLGYATITQVGIIWIEIALGFTNFALFHMVTHASLRTWQFLRSSSIIFDFYENPIVQKDVMISRSLSFENVFSKNFKKKVFVHALHGFHLDFFTMKIINFIGFPFKFLMQIENKWMEWDTELLRSLIRKNKE